VTWGVAFLLTQCVEVPLYAWLLRAELPVSRRLGVAVTASVLTHPWLWFVLPPLLVPRLGYTGFVVVGEALVTLVEAGLLVLVGVPSRGALVAACVANAASLAVGWIVGRVW